MVLSTWLSACSWHLLLFPQPTHLPSRSLPLSFCALLRLSLLTSVPLLSLFCLSLSAFPIWTRLLLFSARLLAIALLLPFALFSLGLSQPVLVLGLALLLAPNSLAFALATTARPSSPECALSLTLSVAHRREAPARSPLFEEQRGHSTLTLLSPRDGCFPLLITETSLLPLPC